MTVWEVIDALNTVPPHARHLPLYIWDGESNLPVAGVSRFDSDAPYGPDNPLAVDVRED